MIVAPQSTMIRGGGVVTGTGPGSHGPLKRPGFGSEIPEEGLGFFRSGARRTSSGLTHHSDRGVQYVSLAYTDALVAAGVTASVGTVGDSYDNALAESINGLYKTEIIQSRGVWDSATAVEIAILEWVHWWNTARLHESLAYRTPAQVEAACTEIEATAPVVP